MQHTPRRDRSSEPIPDYGDHMTVADFKDSVECGLFTDDDGHGYYATDKVMTRQRVDLSNVDMDHTHVVWFNK